MIFNTKQPLLLFWLISTALEREKNKIGAIVSYFSIGCICKPSPCSMTMVICVVFFHRMQFIRMRATITQSHSSHHRCCLLLLEPNAHTASDGTYAIYNWLMCAYYYICDICSFCRFSFWSFHYIIVCTLFSSSSSMYFFSCGMYVCSRSAHSALLLFASSNRAFNLNSITHHRRRRSYFSSACVVCVFFFCLLLLLLLSSLSEPSPHTYIPYTPTESE